MCKVERSSFSASGRSIGGRWNERKRNSRSLRKQDGDGTDRNGCREQNTEIVFVGLTENLDSSAPRETDDEVRFSSRH